MFNKLNLPKFKIYINNRKLLGGFLQSLDIADKTVEVLRLVDKIKKIPEEAFLGELGDLGLAEDKKQSLLKFIKINGLNDEIIAKLEELNISNENFAAGLAELKTVITQAQNLGLPAQNIQIDLSITRGLDYYTGTVYETFFDEYPQFGSVCSGGRYDNLSSVFMDKKFPGVGISIGLTRLFDQLRTNNLLQFKELTPSKALIVPQDESLIEAAVKLAGKLRNADIAVDVMYRQCKFKKKMEYANKIGVPYLVIIGEEEAKTGLFACKDMITGEQKALNLDELIETLK